MDLLTLIFFGLVAIILAIWWEHRRKVQQQRQAEATTPLEAADPITAEAVNTGFMARLTNEIRDFRLNFTPAPPSGLPEKLRVWSNTALTEDPTLKSWLNSLPDEALAGFTQHLGEFCNQLGFELAWLFDDQLDQQPELSHKLATVISDYSRACHTAVLVQPDIAIFKAYQAFTTSPYEKVNQELGKKIFTQLVERNLTPTIPANLFMATEHERQIYMVQAIRQAAEQEPVAFAQVLRNAIAALSAPAASPPSSPTVASQSGQVVAAASVAG